MLVINVKIKIRKKWIKSPATKVHNSKKVYNRNKEKHYIKKIIKEEAGI